MVRIEDIKNIELKYSTPFYMFDIDALEIYIKNILCRYKNTKICYAMKANPLLVGFIAKWIDKIEVCSMGEFEICLSQKVSFEKIILSGVYKNYDDIMNILKLENSEKITYTIESVDQFKMFSNLSKILNKNISLLLRLSSGNQFGMEPEDIYRVIKESISNNNINIRGLQYYAGTQKKYTENMKNEIFDIIQFMSKIENDFNIRLSEIEIGPGLYFEYFKNEKNEDYLDELIEDISECKFVVTLELGRYLVAFCGYYISKVVDLKKNFGKNYVIIDGGTQHLNYYGQIMGMRVPKINIIRNNEIDLSEEYKYTVCGSLCTSADVIIKNLTTPKLNVGDVIIFFNTGAYSITESMYLFLSHDIPKVILKINGDFVVGRNDIKTSLINTLSY